MTNKNEMRGTVFCVFIHQNDFRPASRRIKTTQNEHVVHVASIDISYNYLRKFGERLDRVQIVVER